MMAVWAPVPAKIEFDLQLFQTIYNYLKMSLINNIDNPFQTYPEHHLYKMFINEYESMLTIGRTDNGLNPYDLQTQIQMVKNQNQKFISVVQNMVVDYLLDDDLSSLDNPEPDWIREYFYDNEINVFDE